MIKEITFNEKQDPKKVRKYAALVKWYLREDKHEILEKTYSRKVALNLKDKCTLLNQRDVNQLWYYTLTIYTEMV